MKTEDRQVEEAGVRRCTRKCGKSARRGMLGVDRVGNRRS